MKEKPCCPWLTASMKIVFTVDWWHKGRTGIDHLAQHLRLAGSRIKNCSLKKKSKVNGVLTPKDPHAWCQWQPAGPGGPVPPSAVRARAV